MSIIKHPLSYAFAISVCALLQTTASYGSTSVSKADQDMFEIAAPHHSTMKLTAHTPLGEFFSGSATYIGQNKAGDYIALTNAHCVQFWHRATKCLASFTIDHVTEDGIQQFPITDIEFHPQWFSSQQDPNYDIVKLKLNINTLPDALLETPVKYDLATETIEAPTLTKFDVSVLGPEPTLPPECDELENPSVLKDMEKYNSDLKEYNLRFNSALIAHEEKMTGVIDQYMKSLKPFDGQSFVSVGYGTDGPCRQTHFAKNDQKKRGSSIRLSVNIPDQNGINRKIRSHPLGQEYNNETQSYNDIKDDEYGLRFGMSGGGLYRFKETDEDQNQNEGKNYELIGINRGGGFISTSFLNNTVMKTLSLYQNYIGKYVTASGTPMPFMNPVKGKTSVFISLSPIEEWINNPVTANGQTAAQYLYSWIPGKTTSAVMTASASMIGYAAWSYFG